MDKIFVDHNTKDQSGINRVKRHLVVGLPVYIEERGRYIQATKQFPAECPIDSVIMALGHKNAVYEHVDISRLLPQEYRLIERLDKDIAVKLPFASFGGFLSYFKESMIEKIFEGLFPVYFAYKDEITSKEEAIVVSYDRPVLSEITTVDASIRPWQLAGGGNNVVRQEIERIYRAKRVVFICTGNSCRSVMAEYLLKDMLRRSAYEPLDEIEVFSCGTMVIDGVGGAMNTVIDLLAKDGIDATGHIRKGLKEYLILGADLIFVMEDMHEDVLLKYYPFLKNRIYLLGEFSKINNADTQIIDPIGGSWEVYEHTYSIIKDAVSNVFNMLVKMEGQK